MHVQPTITTGLNGGLNVTDALDSHTVLVIAINILVLELANFVDEDTQLVGDVRYVVVAGFAPDGELLLRDGLVRHRLVTHGLVQTYGNLHALPGNQLHAAHDVLLHLDKL